MENATQAKCNNYGNCFLADTDEIIDVQDWTNPPPHCLECDKDLKQTTDIPQTHTSFPMAAILAAIILLIGLSIYVIQNFHETASPRPIIHEPVPPRPIIHEPVPPRPIIHEPVPPRPIIHEPDELIEPEDRELAKQMEETIAIYKSMFHDKIRSNLIKPPDLPKDPVVEFNVLLIRHNGKVAYATVSKTSGFEAYDKAVKRAIKISQPFALPTNSKENNYVLNELTHLNITMHYLELSP